MNQASIYLIAITERVLLLLLLFLRTIQITAHTMEMIFLLLSSDDEESKQPPRGAVVVNDEPSFSP